MSKDGDIKRKQAEDLLREAQQADIEEIVEAEKDAAEETAKAQQQAIEGAKGGTSGSTSGVGIIDQLFKR